MAWCIGVSVVGGFNKAYLKLDLKTYRPSSVTNCDESYYKFQLVDLLQTARLSRRFLTLMFLR